MEIGEMANTKNNAKRDEGLSVTGKCTITQNGKTRCCISRLLRQNLPDTAFSASSGKLFIFNKHNFSIHVLQQICFKFTTETNTINFCCFRIHRK